MPGEPKVSLGPLTVRAGGGNDLSVAWEEDKLPAVRVTTAVESPSVDALRPPTDIEPLPPEPPVEGHSTGWLFAIIPGLLAASALLLLFARRKKTPPAPRDAAWALRELAAGDLTADRCAVVLRQYAAFRFGVPAGFQTTPELAAALGAENRLPADAVADWRALLEECDAARFWGRRPRSPGCATGPGPWSRRRRRRSAFNHRWHREHREDNKTGLQAGRAGGGLAFRPVCPVCVSVPLW